MAQPAERKGGRGENPLNVISFWDARTPEPPTYWEEYVRKGEKTERPKQRSKVVQALF